MSRSTSRFAGIVLPLCLALSGLFEGSTSLAADPPPPAEPAAFKAVGPVRLADTREAACGCTRLDNETIRVKVAGRDGLDADVSAVAITVTATASTRSGFVTAYPSGGDRPGTSTLNLSVGAASSNSTIIPIGPDGAIDVFANVATNLIVDVTGTFSPSPTSAGGRFRSTVPARLLDTRSSTASGLAPGAAAIVALPSAVAADARALVVNVTSVDAPRAGFLTGHAAGTPAPPTSFMNPDGSGSPKAALVVLPASALGVTISSSAGGHVIVDLVGWFTGDSSPVSNEGLLVAVAPRRLVDTRTAAPRIWPGGIREVPLPVDTASALVTNVTLVQPDTAGFVTAYPAGTPLPPTSSVNVASRNAVTPNLAITTVSSRGTGYLSSHGTDLVVDLTGYFTGPPVTATEPVAANVAPVPTALMIGDSTLGGLVEIPSAQKALRGFKPILDAKPCRRLVRPSCTSSFTLIAPNTAVEAINAAPPGIDLVVIKAGYNESGGEFPASLARVMSAARAKGARAVIWLTYSESNTPGNYNNANALLHQVAGTATYPDLVVADWRAYAASSNGWYAADRVHLASTGVWATADYISRWVATVAHLPCPVPWTPGGPVDDPCSSPDEFAALNGTPALRSLYGF